MPTPPAIFAVAGKTIEQRLTLKVTSNDSIIYESNSLDTMMNFVSTYSTANNITVPITLMFNTSYTYSLSSMLVFNFANNGNLFTIKAKTGVFPVLDGGGTLTSIIVNSMSNFMWDGINCSNSNVADTAGCLIRNNSSTINITYQNMTFSKGYCAMRGTGVQDVNGNSTSIIENLTIKNCVVSDTINGSFRLGNGDVGTIPGETNFSLRTPAYYDIKNVVIEDIKLIDSYSKGVIPGQLTGFMGMFILKKILGLTINNVTCNNTSEGVISLESSSNVIINRVYAQNFCFAGVSNQQGLNITNTIGLVIKNVFLNPNNDGTGKTIMNFNNVKGLELYHNTCAFINNNDVPFYASNMAVMKMSGNVFKSSGSQNPCVILFTTANGYAPSIAQDLLVENNNVFCSAGTYNVNLEISESPRRAVPIDILVQVNTTGTKINPATYRSTYGLGANSLFPTDTEVLFTTRVNPNNSTSSAFYLTDVSIGRNLVTTQVSDVTKDTFGFIRTLPTDAGACDKDAIVLV